MCLRRAARAVQAVFEELGLPEVADAEVDAAASGYDSADMPDRDRAADVDAAEVYPVVGTRFGDVWQRVRGRKGAVVNVHGFKRRDQRWHFESSTDRGSTWAITDAGLAIDRMQVQEGEIQRPLTHSELSDVLTGALRIVAAPDAKP